MINRISWTDYFMELSEAVSKRSTCLRRQVGAIAVIDKRIVATGYNGATYKERHCIDIGCLRDALNIPSGTQQEKCMAVHAEQNVICQAAKSGVSLKGATLYCTTKPCSICLKMIINSGIEKVVYKSEYPDDLVNQIISKNTTLEKYEESI